MAFFLILVLRSLVYIDTNEAWLDGSQDDGRWRLGIGRKSAVDLSGEVVKKEKCAGRWIRERKSEARKGREPRS